MIEIMTLDDFYQVSQHLDRHMSVRRLVYAAQQFSQDKEITIEEAKAILLVAFTIVTGASIADLLLTRERRMKELDKLGIQYKTEGD